MNPLIRAVLTHIGAISSLVLGIALATDWRTLQSSPWKFLLFVATGVAAIALAAWDITATAKSLPKIFRGEDRKLGILKYMTQLIESDGQCTMCSNDLSWVDPRAKAALLKKAKAGSLQLIMPRPTDLSRELSEAGSRNYYYSTDAFRFASRFTLSNYGRAGEWIAIGLSGKDSHVIREITDPGDPTLTMAKDLIALAMKISVPENHHA